MLTIDTMFLDEEDITMMTIVPEETLINVPEQTRFDSARTEPYYGTYVTSSSRKPTKQEAVDRLNELPAVKLTRSVRRSTRLPPIIMLPLYAPELARILVEIDPLDRIEG